MNKTLILKGLTGSPAAAGLNADTVLDITEKVIGVNPALSTPVVTEQFFSTIVAEVNEGAAKYLIDRKAHVKQNNTTAEVQTGTVGAVTTAGFKEHKRDQFTFTLNKSWEAGFVYDKKKDPMVREGQLISDVASLQEDVKENKAASFWDAVNTDIAGAKSAAHKAYVSSGDDKVALAAPDLKKTIAFADKDKAEVYVDAIFNAISEISLMGRKNGAHQFFPYARGTRGALGLKVVVKEKMIPLLSKDARYVAAELSPKMIETGVIGYINNIPVMKDEMFDTTVTNADIAVIGTGKYSPVIVAEELPEAFELFDHPTRPTRAQLLEGSGGFDTHVTPYINLARFINTAASAK